MNATVARILLAAVLAGASAAPAAAFTVPIDSNPPSVYLRVGDGGSRQYCYDTWFGRRCPGMLDSSGVVNTVAATVSSADLVATPRVPVAMSSDANQLTSSYEGFTFCNPGELYVGGFVRGGASNGTLRANAPASLTDGSGQTIPFSQISWTSSGIGDGNTPQPVRAGNFDALDGPQTLDMFARNVWHESCLSFRYANAAIVGAGTYRATVTYTLSAP